ncbi:MAG: prepilin-type N-terminal cleavage/methylation domain-containing protein [Alphaproteobacteria bacterium]|nr:prepilin-type N-terminal cleavage/methylation domain-containing protein [Alphaproteobacteria bacterium]
MYDSDEGAKSFRHSQDGFTLVEMAIVFVIVGLVMLMGVGVVRNYYIHIQHQKTVDNIRMTQAALGEYLGIMGRYPCPADPTLPPADVNYGREQCRTSPLPDDCAGTPAGIECTNDDSRDVDGDGLPEVVMIGMLPSRDIQDLVTGTPFREAHILDGYGLRLTYAVTEAMTDNANNTANPVNNAIGAIRVEDENGTSLTVPDRSAHFVIVSHGQNGKGGYLQNGNIFPDCNVMILGVPAPAPPGSFGGVDPEKENCDRNDAIFVKGIKSMIENSNNYYDDIVFFRAGGFQSLWTHSLNSPAGKTWINNTNLGNVGVGPTLAMPQQAMHIAGDLSAQTEVKAQAYCGLAGPTGLDCLIPATIGGVGTKCPSATDAAFGIADNTLLCRQVFSSKAIFASKTCPAGQYLVAISNKGNIKCAPL